MENVEPPMLDTVSWIDVASRSFYFPEEIGSVYSQTLEIRNSASPKKKQNESRIASSTFREMHSLL